MEPKRRIFCYTPETLLETVLREVGLPASNQWKLSLFPSPHHEKSTPVLTIDKLAHKKLSEIGVVFGSTLSFERTSAASALTSAAHLLMNRRPTRRLKLIVRGTLFRHNCPLMARAIARGRPNQPTDCRQSIPGGVIQHANEKIRSRCCCRDGCG